MPNQKPRNDTPRSLPWYHNCLSLPKGLEIGDPSEHVSLSSATKTHTSFARQFSLGNWRGQEPISLEDKKIVRTEHFPVLQDLSNEINKLSFAKCRSGLRHDFDEIHSKWMVTWSRKNDNIIQTQSILGRESNPPCTSWHKHTAWVRIRYFKWKQE